MPLFGAADVQAFRDLVSELVFADSYSLVRYTLSAPDGTNARVEVAQVVEQGLCSIRSREINAREEIVANKIGVNVSYFIDMPADTIAQETDTLLVNDPKYEINGMVFPGEMSMAATAICERRSV